MHPRIVGASGHELLQKLNRNRRLAPVDHAPRSQKHRRFADLQLGDLPRPRVAPTGTGPFSPAKLVHGSLEPETDHGQTPHPMGERSVAAPREPRILERIDHLPGAVLLQEHLHEAKGTRVVFGVRAERGLELGARSIELTELQ